MTETRDTTLKQVLIQSAEAVGVSLWGHEFVQEDGRNVLRVYVDKPGNVSLDDCAKASRQMSRVLDVEEIVAGRYNLEVSSPGLKRKLFEPAHYKQYIGGVISVKSRRPIENQKRFKAILDAVLEDHILLKDGDRMVSLPWVDIESAHVLEPRK